MADEKKRRWTAFTTIDEIELSNPDLITPVKISAIRTGTIMLEASKLPISSFSQSTAEPPIT